MHRSPETVILILLYFSFKGNLAQYKKLSRNILKKNKTESNFTYRGREKIINILEKLPKTKHDLVSIIVDVPFVNVSLNILVFVNFIFSVEWEVCI